MSFDISVTTRFHEVDRAGILFFNRAFEYAHICFEEMLTTAFNGIEGTYDTEGIGFPLVHAEASFKQMIRHGDRLTVRLHVERLTERSVTFRHDIVGPEEDLRAVIHMKHAFVRVADLTPTARTPKFDAALKSIGLIGEDCQPLP